MKKTMKIVVVDDNEAVIRSVKEYFKESENISVTRGFVNGKEAVDYLVNNPNEYDFIMLDLILTHYDGLRIIEELNNRGIKKTIMVLSSFKDDFTIRRCQALGASYYMLKPVDMDVVNTRILDLMKDKTDVNVVKTSNMESDISNLLHELGIPTHVRGYQYIREGVLLLYAGDSITCSVTKDVYPSIAKKYQTTSSRVERAIRHAIEISWLRGDITLMQDLFGNSIDFERSRPTNSEFLTTLADKFKLDTKEMIA